MDRSKQGSLRCPKCGKCNTFIICGEQDGREYKRWRRCRDCGEMIVTHEQVVLNARFYGSLKRKGLENG